MYITVHIKRENLIVGNICQLAAMTVNISFIYCQSNVCLFYSTCMHANLHAFFLKGRRTILKARPID